MFTVKRGLLLVALCSMLLAGAAVMAQEATPEASPADTTTTSTTGMITCDSDLILNLYIAERFFSFGAVRNSMMTAGADMTTMVDLATLDKGQYASLFDSAMGMMDDSMMMPDSAMTAEQVQAMSDTMMMSDADRATMMGSMMGDMTGMTALTPGLMTGEAAECAALRTELTRFYETIAYGNMMMNMSGTTDAGTTTDAGAVASGDVMSWSTTLTGTAEVPGPGDPDGTGTAAVTLDMPNGQICYSLVVQGITLPASAAHIHRGAAGESGDVVVPFDIAPDAAGSATSCVPTDPALMTEIAGNPAGFYVNVHTSDFPDGALRGQVVGP